MMLSLRLSKRLQSLRGCGRTSDHPDRPRKTAGSGAARRDDAGQNGWEVARKLRNDPQFANVGIVMLTAIGEKVNG